MDQYHFLAGECKKNTSFDPAAASGHLFAWLAQIGATVERYGNKRGKIVDFLTFWYLPSEKLEPARAALNAHPMLAAYIHN